MEIGLLISSLHVLNLNITAIVDACHVRGWQACADAVWLADVKIVFI